MVYFSLEELINNKLAARAFYIQRLAHTLVNLHVCNRIGLIYLQLQRWNSCLEPCHAVIEAIKR